MGRIKSKNIIKEWGLALLFALIVALSIKAFIARSFIVASSKMEKTIFDGDFIMVNKLIFGTRLPITLLSLPFTHAIYSNSVLLPYYRTPAISNIARNDIIVFNYPAKGNTPIDKKEPMVKRCIALPGDTITINDKNIFVNDRLTKGINNLQFNYRIVTNGQTINQLFLDKYNINEGGMVSEIGIYDFPLTKDKLDLIKKDGNIRYVSELKDFRSVKSDLIFPMGKNYSYNKDNFGPLVIPFKGQKVLINTHTIDLYKDIIKDYEGNNLIIHNNEILINGIECTTYTIKHNYYFVLDDNRDNANDSRYWGFLPESHIIGKPSFIWFSFDKQRKKVRWNRIFKTI